MSILIYLATSILKLNCDVTPPAKSMSAKWCLYGSLLMGDLYGLIYEGAALDWIVSSWLSVQRFCECNTVVFVVSILLPGSCLESFYCGNCNVSIRTPQNLCLHTP